MRNFADVIKTLDSSNKTTVKVEAGFTIRKGINHRHAFRLSFVDELIPDTIAAIIANNAVKGYLPYFTDNKSRQRFGEFVYTYQYFNANNNIYPWKGFLFWSGRLCLFQQWGIRG